MVTRRSERWRTSGRAPSGWITRRVIRRFWRRI
nr:MAG TPA: hypothetical protein [Caudoviricetes sp.]